MDLSATINHSWDEEVRKKNHFVSQGLSIFAALSPLTDGASIKRGNQAGEKKRKRKMTSLTIISSRERMFAKGKLNAKAANDLRKRRRGSGAPECSESRMKGGF